MSYSYSKSAPFSYRLTARTTLPSYHMFSTVILFWVRVPVLSEQMHEVDPSVSTASRFFTRTCLSASLLAVMEREMVMQARRPSGTLATRIPIPKMMHWSALYLTTRRARMKKTAPSEMAMTVMMSTNLSNYILKGERWFPPVAARSAIWPMTVFAPMLITIPLPEPSLQRVPKKARFLVSKGYSGWVHSGLRSRG